MTAIADRDGIATPGNARSGSASTSGSRLAEIDALRGIAAIGVVVFHMLTTMLPASDVASLQGTLIGKLVITNMWTLVDLFFVLSGFIFAQVYLDADDRLKPRATLRSFTVARIARLYPLHLITLVAVSALVTLQMPNEGVLAAPPVGHYFYDAYHFALNIVFLQGSGLERGMNFNSPSWSLSSEAFCYAAFFVIARHGGGRTVALGAVVVAIALISAAQDTVSIMPLSIARGLIGFFIGLIVQRRRHLIDHVPTWVLMACLVASLLIPKMMGASWHLNYGIRFSLAAWPIAMLLSMRGVMPRVLALPGLKTLGDLSYSTYLIHMPIMMVFIMANGGHLFATGAMTIVGPAFIGITLALSWASYRWVEQPARDAINRHGAPRALPAETRSDVF